MHLAPLIPPLPRSYVVFLPVVAGEYPGAGRDAETRARLRRLLENGIDAFLDLTEAGEREPYAHLLPARVRHERHPLRRDEVPSPEQMRTIVDAIERLCAGGWLLYAHDANGNGRVGTAVGCWLADREALDRNPLTFLAELRRHVPAMAPSPADPGQRAFVDGWSRGRWSVRAAARVAEHATDAVSEQRQPSGSGGGMR